MRSFNSIVILTIALPIGAEAVTLRLLDQATGLSSKSVTVPQVGAVVSIQLKVIVDLTGGETLINALAGGVQVDNPHSGQFRISGYTYQPPYASFDPQGGAAGSTLADSPVGVLSPNNSKANPPYSGVGFFTPTPTGDEYIGILDISSLNAVPPGETVTFALNGEVAVNGVEVASPSIAAFTLTTALPSCTAPTLASAQSVKTHGGAGEFGIGLGVAPLMGEVECRAGGPTRINVTFGGPIRAADGTLNSGPGNEVEVSSNPAAAMTVTDLSIVNGNTLRIDLAGASDRSCLSVHLHGIACNDGGVSGPTMTDATLLQRIAAGDAGNNGKISSADVLLASSQSGNSVVGTNFRSDVIADGSIGSADKNLVKSHSDGRQVICP